MYLPPALWAWIRAPATHYLGARILITSTTSTPPAALSALPQHLPPPFSVIVLSSQYLFQRGPIWVIGSWAALLKMGQLNPAQLTIGSWAWPILRWAGWEVGLQHFYTCVSDDSTNRHIKKIFEEGLLNPTRTTTFISQFYLIPNEALRHLRKSWHFARIVIGVPWYSQLHLSRFTKTLLHMSDHVHALDANKFMPIAAETTGLFG